MTMLAGWQGTCLVIVWLEVLACGAPARIELHEHAPTCTCCRVLTAGGMGMMHGAWGLCETRTDAGRDCIAEPMQMSLSDISHCMQG